MNSRRSFGGLALPGKYPRAAARAHQMVAFLRTHAIHVAGCVIERVVLADPDDDVLFACAAEGQAHFIVSGNQHVLAIGEHRDVRVVTARDFLQILVV